MVNLTARRLQTLSLPSKGRLELSDDAQRGLKFRLTEKGVATWSLQVTLRGRKRRFTIGPYPEIGLAEARDRAARLLIEVIDGRDPVKERRSANSKAEITVQAALDDYDKLHLAPNLRTGAERRRQLEQSLADHLPQPAADLTRTDIQRIIDEKASRAPVAANRLRAALSAFLSWCWRRGYVESNFALATSRAAKEISRDRVLSLSEIHKLWFAAGEMGMLWGPYLKLLLLTAQRRGDLAQMEWNEVELASRRWLIPGTKTKNGRPHIVPLSTRAVGVLEQLKVAKTKDEALVFSTTGSTPVSGFSRMKARLDAVVGFADWRLHDIRTAFATHLADRGFDEGVIDRVLNHVASASSASTVARVYNRAERLADRARALDQWAELIDASVMEYD